MLLREPRRVPRFLKQMADNALRHRAPLDWLGAHRHDAATAAMMLDLKLHGTAIFVDAARLYALAHGIDASSTRARLEAAAPRAAACRPREGEAWVGGLRVPADAAPARAARARAGEPARRDPTTSTWRA